VGGLSEVFCQAGTRPRAHPARINASNRAKVRVVEQGIVTMRSAMASRSGLAQTYFDVPLLGDNRRAA
jgi:hypothetical protein